jgi:hypothetical protein
MLKAVSLLFKRAHNPQWNERALLVGGYCGADPHPGLAAFRFIGCSFQVARDVLRSGLAGSP